jgi:hypothetical protein
VNDTGETSGTALAERRKRRQGVVLLIVAAFLLVGTLALGFSPNTWVRVARMALLIPVLGCWIDAGRRLAWPTRHEWVPLLAVGVVLVISWYLAIFVDFR